MLYERLKLNREKFDAHAFLRVMYGMITLLKLKTLYALAYAHKFGNVLLLHQMS